MGAPPLSPPLSLFLGGLLGPAWCLASARPVLGPGCSLPSSHTHPDFCWGPRVGATRVLPGASLRAKLRALLQAGRCGGTDFREACSLGRRKDYEPRETFCVPAWLSGLPASAWPAPRLLCPPPDQASERLSAHRASARGRIRARTPRAGALRSPEICPSEGLLPTVAPPRLKLQTRRLGAQDSSPRGSRAGAPRRSLPGMLCERAGRDAPLQTATRTWVFCFLFFGLFFFFFFPLFPPLLSVPRPPASRSPPASGPRPNGAAFTIVQIQARVCLGV